MSPPIFRLFPIGLLFVLLLCAPGAGVRAQEVGGRSPDRIVKVLAHVLDAEGRHSLSPSLLERDAYQAALRLQPDQIRGMRFDVQYREGRRRPTRDALMLRMELRPGAADDGRQVTLEVPIQRPRWRLGRSGWVAVRLDGEIFRELGKVSAWRATLFRDGVEVAASQSFLW